MCLPFGFLVYPSTHARTENGGNTRGGARLEGFPTEEDPFLIGVGYSWAGNETQVYCFGVSPIAYQEGKSEQHVPTATATHPNRSQPAH